MTKTKRTQRLRALNKQVERLERRLSDLKLRGDRLSHWRLGSFVLFFLLGSFIFVTWGALPWAVVNLILLLPFVLTVRWHRQVENSIKRHQLWLELKRVQVARMMLDWDHIPAREPCQVVENHPFATDLDLIGDRSMLRLIDVSITKEGGQRLCDWLLETEPNPRRTAQRQAVVQELMRFPTLRDRLILNATLAGGRFDADQSKQSMLGAGNGTVKAKWSAEPLLQWLGKEVETKSLRLVLIVLLLFVPLNLILLAGFLNGLLPPLWLISWLVYGAIMLSQSRKVGPLFRDAAYLNDSLRQLSAVFDILEARPFERSPALRELLLPLRKKDRRPSKQLRRANRLLSAAGLRINPVVAFMLNVFFPWDIFLAYRLTLFRQELAKLVPDWLDLWFELEALHGLANFGTLNPEATFAEFISVKVDIPTSGSNGEGTKRDLEPPLTAASLGHPLIPADERVYNDFVVHELGTVLIISGSNMSGKSTFLRSLGVNICLAEAGAPVLATSLRLVPFRIAASITIVDSLMDGFSFFYAEVRRLRALLEDLQKPHTYPLFFMIDEIFRGTNNRERLIGSRSFVQALVGCFGTGAIATHDLELVKLAETNDSIRNGHFRDDVENGRMVFDYKLHQGPCPTTNALKIMRLAGLPIDPEELVETGTS